MVTLLIVKKYNRPEHSFMGILRLIVRQEATDPRIFVVRDEAEFGSSSVSVSSVTPLNPSSSTPDIILPDEDYCYTITPNRTLVSIASLADLRYLPLTPEQFGDLYRTDTFTVICRSIGELEAYLNAVIADIKTNLRLQRAHYEDVEIAVLDDYPLAGGR